MQMRKAVWLAALWALTATCGIASAAPERGGGSALTVQKAADRNTALPAALQKALARTKVRADDVVVAVYPIDAVRRTDEGSNIRKVPATLLYRADVPMAPASSAKVVTTLVGLETLGSRYRWHTSFYTDPEKTPDRNGRLRAPLYVKGGGDPNFVLEAFEMELERLAQRGLRHLEGDIVIDRSLFDIPETDRYAFDGRGTRPYNLPPDAALVNYRNVSFEMTPDRKAGVARIATFPKLAGVSAPATIRLKTKGGCGDWKTAIGYHLQRNKDGTVRVRFDGALPAACGPKNFNVISFEADEYFERLFRALWVRDGRTWKGHVRTGKVPDKAERLLVHTSPDAGDVVKLVNKWSNNTMARHVFLTLGVANLEKEAEEAGVEIEEGKLHRGIRLEDARAVIAAWQQKQGIETKDFFFENGSGLSRTTVVTARAMAQTLAVGAQGPYAPEFMASLPITGEDGTMARRKVAVSWGRIKTGFLRDVRSIAGYVHAQDGRRYAVYAAVHGERSMPGAQAFLDSVIRWVYER